MKLRKFQMGGAMPEEAPIEAGAEMGAIAGAEAGAMAGAEAAAAEQDPIVQLVEMAMQALQAQDPQMAMAVCEGLISLVQAAGGGAPAPGVAPEEPVMMRKGGKMICKKGAKMRKKKC